MTTQEQPAPAPSKRKTPLQIHLDEPMLDRLRELARVSQLSIGETIRRIVGRALTNHDQAVARRAAKKAKKA